MPGPQWRRCCVDTTSSSMDGRSYRRRRIPRRRTLGRSRRERRTILEYVPDANRIGLKCRMMLKWPDVLNLAKAGNPAPDRKVIKTDAEWRAQLTDEQYHVTRQAGTERPFSSEMCSLFGPGIYSCLCC